MVRRLNETNQSPRLILNYNENNRNMTQINIDVNKAVHATDLYWQLYRSAMTHSAISLDYHRNYIKQYDCFIDAVKHYYYDGKENEFKSSTNFNTVINMLSRSKMELDNELHGSSKKNLDYAISKIINFIKTKFLGEIIDD